MRKIIGAINMTLDGFCDHTYGDPDEEVHDHYTELIDSGGAILYGRITYQLMEFWPPLVKNPSGNKAMDEFAVAIDKIPKVVFSNTLKNIEWETARLATHDVVEEVIALRQEPGKDILAGSRSIIINLLNHHLLDELQICILPVIAGKGLPLFENVRTLMNLALTETKVFKKSGSVIHYYKMANDKARV